MQNIPRKCEICNGPLPAGAPATKRICDSWRCRVRSLAKHGRKVQRPGEQSYQQRCQQLAQEQLSRLECDEASNVMPVVIPANTHRLSSLSERRRREFREHLVRIISRASQARFRSGSAKKASLPVVQDSAREQDESVEQGLMLSACATCKGYCCRHGGAEALVTAETIERLMDRHPELRPSDVLEMYLKRLGGETYEDSCVFHTQTGCALTSEMRSDLCNRFVCEALADFWEQTQKSNATSFFLVAIDKGKVVDTRLVSRSESAMEKLGLGREGKPDKFR